jgi:hypothetical protein
MRALACVGVVLTSGMASAAPSQLVVLQDLPGVAAETAEQIGAVTRREVDRSTDWAWKDPPPISMDELVLAAGCVKPDEECLGQLGGLLKADAVALLQVTGGTRATVVVMQFRPQKRVFRGESPAAAPQNLVQAVADALRAALGPVREGSLDLQSTPPGAQVFVDGKAAGVTPLKLNGVPAGKHAVKLVAAGFNPLERPVTVGSGSTSRLQVTLQKPRGTATTAPAPAALDPGAPPAAGSGTTTSAGPTTATQQGAVPADPVQGQPAAAGPARDPAAKDTSNGGGGIPLPVRLALMGTGGVGVVAGVLGLLGGGAFVSYSASLYVALASRTFQRAADFGNLYTYYGAYAVGGTLVVVSILVVVGALGLGAAGVALGLL